LNPTTRYARSADVNIAYQVVGEGPRDLVLVPGWVSQVEAMWEEPTHEAFLRRLASFSRLIVFDKRGTGLSDRVRVDRLPTLDDRMDDVRAVMDAAESECAAVFGTSEGGVMSALFAATYKGSTGRMALVRGQENPESYIGPHCNEPRTAWVKGCSKLHLRRPRAGVQLFLNSWS
jgi:pimeloyl-ACP methyl ester carboxylesterase